MHFCILMCQSGRHHATENLILPRPRKYYRTNIDTRWVMSAREGDQAVQLSDSTSTAIGNYVPSLVRPNKTLYITHKGPTFLLWIRGLQSANSSQHFPSNHDVSQHRRNGSVVEEIMETTPLYLSKMDHQVWICRRTKKPIRTPACPWTLIHLHVQP